MPHYIIIRARLIDHPEFWDGWGWTEDMSEAKVFTESRMKACGIPVAGSWAKLPDVSPKFSVDE